MKSMLPATERSSTTRVGAIAVSGVRASTSRKTTKVTAKVTSRLMIRGADCRTEEYKSAFVAQMRCILQYLPKNK